MSQSRFLFLDQDQYKMVSKEIPDFSTGVSKPMSFFIVSLEYIRLFDARERHGESTDSCHAFILLRRLFTISRGSYCWSTAWKSCSSSEAGSSSDFTDTVSSQLPSSALDLSPVRATKRTEVLLLVSWETKACLTTDTAWGFFLRSLRIRQSWTSYHKENNS